jgi:hypothetical protein
MCEMCHYRDIGGIGDKTETGEMYVWKIQPETTTRLRYYGVSGYFGYLFRLIRFDVIHLVKSANSACLVKHIEI